MAWALAPDGRIVGRYSVPTPIGYPRPGWVEQSGDAIWRATTAAIDGCLSSLPAPATIGAIGVSDQLETVLLWRRGHGAPGSWINRAQHSLSDFRQSGSSRP